MAVAEIAYVLKHVEYKAGSNIPWSIRQMAVYQNFNGATKTTSNILIQTSQNVQKQVFKLVQEGTMAVFPDHWKNVHEIHLSSLSNNWIDYVKFLESKISDIVSLSEGTYIELVTDFGVGRCGTICEKRYPWPGDLRHTAAAQQIQRYHDQDVFHSSDEH